MYTLTKDEMAEIDALLVKLSRRAWQQERNEQHQARLLGWALPGASQEDTEIMAHATLADYVKGRASQLSERRRLRAELAKVDGALKPA